MGTQLNIKSEDAYRLASRLSELTGESLTTVVTKALRSELDREQRLRDKAALEGKAPGDRGPDQGPTCPDDVTSDHGWLYDEETGLPKVIIDLSAGARDCPAKESDGRRFLRARSWTPNPAGCRSRTGSKRPWSWTGEAMPFAANWFDEFMKDVQDRAGAGFGLSAANRTPRLARIWPRRAPRPPELWRLFCLRARQGDRRTPPVQGQRFRADRRRAGTEGLI